jgi:hypothetical protein
MPEYDLDGARDEAVEALILFTLHAKRTYKKFSDVRRLEDLGRQYVSSQARYTTMLYKWEDEIDG